MSIIHEALKKVQNDLEHKSSSPVAAPGPSPKRAGKTALLLLLLFLTALSAGYLYLHAQSSKQTVATPATPAPQTPPPAQVSAAAQPAPQPVPPSAPKPQDPHAFNIQGIMSDQRGNVALINDKIYAEGDAIDNGKIVRISLDSIVISRDGQEEIIAVKR